jgi:HEPN domain-containing protein
MQDHKNARRMFKLAEKDFKALNNMTDEALFDIEIFGFHAQQTVEKLLKAWLSVSGIKYERIHDLQILFSLLKEQGQNIPPEFEELEYLTDFAVTFRYELYENTDASFNRQDILKRIENLMHKVEALIPKI